MYQVIRYTNLRPGFNKTMCDFDREWSHLNVMVQCHIYLHGVSLKEEDIRVIFGNFDSEMARKVFCAVRVFVMVNTIV